MARPLDCRLLLLTPRGAGGVAVLACEGSGRARLAKKILGDARAPGGELDAVPRVRWLWLRGEPVDQVLAFDRPECGWIEVHMHASEAVLRRVEADLGCTQALALTPVATLLGTTRSAPQLACVLEQAAILREWGGDFSAWLAAHARARPLLAAALERSERALASLRPCPVVLCGRKNAGKSTLMNRLLFHERVLTGAEPGLTRDPVGEIAMLDGYPYELVDTAGEGEPVDVLDARAMSLGRAARTGAWRMIVVDTSQPVGAVERQLVAESEHHVVIGTKADLPAAAWSADLRAPDVRVACLEPSAAPTVRASIGALLRRGRGLPEIGPVGGVAALDDGQMAALRAAFASSA